MELRSTGRNTLHKRFWIARRQGFQNESKYCFLYFWSYLSIKINFLSYSFIKFCCGKVKNRETLMNISFEKNDCWNRAGCRMALKSSIFSFGVPTALIWHTPRPKETGILKRTFTPPHGGHNLLVYVSAWRNCPLPVAAIFLAAFTSRSKLRLQ